MASQIGLIGLEPDELTSLRCLLRLLRHPDPVVVALSRQALAYLETISEQPCSAVDL
jgi:hypothetical protein